MLTIKSLNAADRGFNADLRQHLAYSAQNDTQVVQTVEAIIAAVKTQGDVAVLDYTREFDRFEVEAAADLELDADKWREQAQLIDDDQRAALQAAALRIRTYAEHQKADSWQFEQDGVQLGQQITALERVGLYVPGGKAAYPSSVLMNAIPAKVAGVGELIMVVPTPDGVLNPMVLAAADIAGVDRIFTIGGAQAVAALAYGTETIPAVDKIVGPGNQYVAAAKRLVFGQVGIDMLAGPSEITVVADASTPAEWTAMDLFSQAEHDEAARAILISPDADYLQAVQTEINRLLPSMSRREIIQQSLQQQGLFVQVASLNEAIEVVNQIAPEHLELAFDQAEDYVTQVRNAGAIFVGRYTTESLGDYCAGSNHVLPTAGTARFASPLGVYDFQKRTSVVYCHQEAAQTLGKVASVLARSEGLTAHAMAAEYRLKDQ